MAQFKNARTARSGSEATSDRLCSTWSVVGSGQEAAPCSRHPLNQTNTRCLIKGSSLQCKCGASPTSTSGPSELQDTISVFERLVNDLLLNDETINKILQKFNPDPCSWYIADTCIIQLDKRSKHNLNIKYKEKYGQAKLLFPVHYGNNHWMLGVIRFDQRSIAVYDSVYGWTECERVRQALLRFCKANSLDAEDVTVSLDASPDIKQRNGIDCGVYVIALALSVLHDVPLRDIQPLIWRFVLCSLFGSPSADSQPLFQPVPTPTETTDQVRAEQGLIDAETLKRSVSTMEQYVYEYERILDLASRQQRILVKREDEHRSNLEVLKWVDEKSHLQGKAVQAWADSHRPSLKRIVRDTTTDPSYRPLLVGLNQHAIHCTTTAKAHLADLKQRQSLVVPRTKGRLKEIGYRLDATMDLESGAKDQS